MAGKPVWEIYEENSQAIRVRCASKKAASLALRMLEIEAPELKHVVRQRRLYDEKTLLKIIEKGLHYVFIEYTKNATVFVPSEVQRVTLLFGYAGTSPQVKISEDYDKLRITISDIIGDDTSAIVDYATKVWESHPEYDEYTEAVERWRVSDKVYYNMFHVGPIPVRSLAKVV